MSIGREPAIWAIACIAGTLLAASPAAAQCQYDVTVIRAPDVCGILGPVLTFGSGLNENGAVVGRWNCPASEHDEAFVWTPDSGLTTLARPTGVSSASATDISDDGVIVGTYIVTNVGFRGYVYDSGRFTELPTLTGAGWSQATAINGGRVVGYRSIGEGVNPSNAFIWSAAGFIDLGVMNGPNSSATAVSDTGRQVVGWTGSNELNSTGFLWDDGALIRLGPIPGGNTSIPTAVGIGGKVVGWGLVPQQGFPFGIPRAFLWKNGQFMELGKLPGNIRSRAHDVNGGRIVGSRGVDIDSTATVGFVWQNRQMTDLNTLISSDPGVVILSAAAINANGSIVGTARGPDGLVAVLLTVAQSRLGDLDGDCRVRVPDLLTLLAAWGPCSPKLDCPADLNSDGTVNQLDLVLLIENWG